MDEIKERLNILYIKLKFCLVFPEDAVLPRQKVSAFRGGMGEMLLRQNCISGRNCAACRFEEACIVRSVMYTRMKKKPPFMTGDDSIGYLLECEDYRTEFRAGDQTHFFLTLFGNNLVYFNQYLQAFYQLGNAGVGKYAAKYQIFAVTTGSGKDVLRGNNVYMENYRPETVYDYVQRRMVKLEKEKFHGEIIFLTPFCVKYRGEYLNRFCSEAIFQALFRRIMMLDYFEKRYLEQPALTWYPQILEQRCEMKATNRYSSTQGTKVTLRGIAGELRFEEMPEKYREYLLAGELLHIGKNSSFGFGKYRVR